MIDIDRSKWARVRFGDVVVNSKETVKDPVAAGLDRVVALGHIEPGNLQLTGWQDAAEGTTFTRRFRAGQTLFAKRRAYQRKVAYAVFDGVCSGDILAFEAKREALVSELLPFIVQSEAFFDHALRTSAGSLSPRTKWQDLATWEFDLPPLDEQTRIAELLWAMERERRAVGVVADALASARDARIREELGTHVEWPRLPLASLLAEPVRNGISAPESNEPSAVPTISISAVRGGNIAIAGNLKYMGVDGAKVKPFELCVGDFLVTRGNGNKRLVGAGGLVREVPPKGCVYPDLLIRLRPSRDRVVPEFLTVVWNERTVHARLLKQAKSTNGIWKVNGKDVSRHEIPVPPLAEQQRILSDLRLFGDAARCLESRFARAGLLHQAISREFFS